MKVIYFQKVIVMTVIFMKITLFTSKIFRIYDFTMVEGDDERSGILTAPHEH